MCVLINGENLSVGQRTMLGNRDQLNTINFGWTGQQFNLDRRCTQHTFFFIYV